MADPQEAADLPGIGDLPEDKGSLQEDATDAHMAETEQATVPVNEDMDSRTSLAGRKRNLQESGQDGNADSDEESDERQRKRVKDHQDSPLVGGLEASITPSPVQVASLVQAEAGTDTQPPASEPSVFRLLQEESERSQTPGAESHSLFNLVAKGSEAQDSKPAPLAITHTVALPSSSWNGGISTGLRTSFGSKPRLSFGLKSTAKPASSLDVTAAPADSGAGGSSTSSALSGNVDSLSLAPPTKLNEDEQDGPDDKNKSLHLKSIFAQFREPASNKVAKPAVTRAIESTGKIILVSCPNTCPSVRRHSRSCDGQGLRGFKRNEFLCI